MTRQQSGYAPLVLALTGAAPSPEAGHRWT
jgi:hypothetical protein